MTRPSESDEAPRNPEFEISVPLKVATPVSQSAFPVTEQQWNQLKGQIEKIRSSENLWFTASLAFLTFSISFLISIFLPGSVENWVMIVLSTGAGIGLVGSILCFIFYKADRSKRMNDIESVLKFMDEIRQTYRE